MPADHARPIGVHCATPTLDSSMGTKAFLWTGVQALVFLRNLRT